ncbi:MAG TPA: hemolysin family protein [Mesorhizobium sp.]|jgi:CBS domain containing-hemolysin-like protein|nr:hemolysin family protein [Mesorhizobium sp.]
MSIRDDSTSSAGLRSAEPGESEGQSRPSPASPVSPPADRPTFLERIAGLFGRRNGATLREDIAEALAESDGAGEAFSPGERAMLANILALREVTVEDVMVPRADIKAAEIGTRLSDLMEMFEQSGHSRMPVYSRTLDDPRGMVHIRDVLSHLTRAARREEGAQGSGVLDLGRVDLGQTIGELNLIRNVHFVPPSMLASDLMARMQATRSQMALVIDEYGGTDGLASLEDIVEMVVGDIADEHDEEEILITRVDEGSFVVDAKAEIEEVEDAVGAPLDVGEHGDSVETIGGLILSVLGRVPIRGEELHVVPGFAFHVLDADPRRVKRVRIVRLDRDGASGARSTDR